MLIREMVKEDNTKIKTIIQASLESHRLDMPGTAYFDPELGNLYEYYEQIDHANYWIVEIDKEVVGGVGIAPFNVIEKMCELQKLYVSPQAQGLGIGRKLVETALEYAAKHYEQCYLETHHTLQTASTLYEKVGFTLLDAPIPGSEHSLMDMWYIKKLKPA